MSEKEPQRAVPPFRPETLEVARSLRRLSGLGEALLQPHAQPFEVLAQSRPEANTALAAALGRVAPQGATPETVEPPSDGVVDIATARAAIAALTAGQSTFSRPEEMIGG